MLLEELENALLRLRLRTNSEIYQVVDNALKMGHDGGINGLRNPQRLRKMLL